jgi:hypothetical protein
MKKEKVLGRFVAPPIFPWLALALGKLQTRADLRRKYLISRLIPLNPANFRTKKIKSPIDLKYEMPAQTPSPVIPPKTAKNQKISAQRTPSVVPDCAQLCPFVPNRSWGGELWLNRKGVAGRFAVKNRTQVYDKRAGEKIGRFGVQSASHIKEWRIFCYKRSR